MKSFAAGLTAGHWGPSYGLLLDHMVMQDVITISEDGTRAKVFRRVSDARDGTEPSSNVLSMRTLKMKRRATPTTGSLGSGKVITYPIRSC